MKGNTASRRSAVVVTLDRELGVRLGIGTALQIAEVCASG